MSAPYEETSKPNIFQKFTRQAEQDDNHVDIRVFDKVENFEDNAAISRALMENEVCIVYLENTTQEIKKRLLDYLHGLIYGINGTITAVGNDCVLCCPKTASVAIGSGDLD